MRVTLRIGECCGVMAELDEASVHAVVTDPPYGLGFMGKDWDSPGGLGDMPMRRNHAHNTVNTGCSRQGGRQRSGPDFQRRQARDARSFAEWSESWSRQALRVLRPGGHLLAFGGTRTFHRLACALEDAGFELRDTLCWLYGQGFPKSRNIGGGWGTALKPAWEPILLARKPTVGSVAANTQAHGTGAINVDGCRIESEGGRARVGEPSQERRYDDRGATNFAATPGPRGGDPAGRWPANVALDQVAAAQLDEQTGTLKSGARSTKVVRGSEKTRGVYCKGWSGDGSQAYPSDVPASEGGASRFFYCAKASKSERGGESLPLLGVEAIKNTHPTVKPVELMRWLVRLVTPPGGLVLDPFAGSGTTGVACQAEGFDCLLIEREAEYAEIAAKRLGVTP